MTNSPNEWRSVEHALAYLVRADEIPHRVEGEAALLDEIPTATERVLDQIATWLIRLFDFCNGDPIQLAWMVNQIGG